MADEYLAVFHSTANAMNCKPIKVESIAEGKRLGKQLKSAGYVVSGVFRVNLDARSAVKVG
jgi:hypothetical protein